LCRLTSRHGDLGTGGTYKKHEGDYDSKHRLLQFG
jgi:hypothetical protein